MDKTKTEPKPPTLATSLGPNPTVEKNIPETDAVTALINLIKSHGDWTEKN